MSEKLRMSSGEQNPEQLHPAEHFRVDPEDYPILRRQWEHPEKFGDNDRITWNIDRTASRYVTETADLIAILDGSAIRPYSEQKYGERPDHVIYLDKSARPVSWLVGTFWDTFSREPRPENSFLNIDRLNWFGIAMPDVARGMAIDHEGNKVRARLEHFLEHADEIPQEVFAGVRALYVEGGVETDDPAEIMKLPTRLDGKNVMIIDEVADTGATLGIAKYILKRAIPEIKSVGGEYFWHQTPKTNPDNSDEKQQTSVPIWYDHDNTEGRGIGELNPSFFEERDERFQTPHTRAQRLGGVVLSEYVDLATERDGKSRELAREFLQLKADFEAGKILLQAVPHWDDEREDARMEALEDLGVKFMPPDAAPKDPTVYMNMIEEINRRPPALY